MFSHALNMPQASVADIKDIAPDWFADTRFEVNPDMIDRYVEARYGGTNAVLHPV